jgi:hypothetical protein
MESVGPAHLRAWVPSLALGVAKVTKTCWLFLCFVFQIEENFLFTFGAIYSLQQLDKEYL